MLCSTVKDDIVSASEIIYQWAHQWAHQWKMEFNPDPTKQATEFLFSCKITSLNHTQLLFNGTVVAKVNEQKHLGLTLHSLSFENI